jgi:hypothetical protein
MESRSKINIIKMCIISRGIDTEERNTPYNLGIAQHFRTLLQKELNKLN